jgi:Protein of unknown function (DUF2778)
MIVFKITDGSLWADGTAIGSGYAGNGDGLNNPNAIPQHAVGPLPIGIYVISAPQNNPHTGPFSLPLIPDPANEMFGRGDFLVHGGLTGEPCDSPSVTPGGTRSASHGCIVTARAVREIIAGHTQLTVIQ